MAPKYDTKTQEALSKTHFFSNNTVALKKAYYAHRVKYNKLVDIYNTFANAFNECKPIAKKASLPQNISLSKMQSALKHLKQSYAVLDRVILLDFAKLGFALCDITSLDIKVNMSNWHDAVYLMQAVEAVTNNPLKDNKAAFQLIANLTLPRLVENAAVEPTITTPRLSV